MKKIFIALFIFVSAFVFGQETVNLTVPETFIGKWYYSIPGREEMEVCEIFPDRIVFYNLPIFSRARDNTYENARYDYFVGKSFSLISVEKTPEGKELVYFKLPNYYNDVVLPSYLAFNPADYGYDWEKVPYDPADDDYIDSILEIQFQTNLENTLQLYTLGVLNNWGYFLYVHRSRISPH
jgi:hypothetical protein